MCLLGGRLALLHLLRLVVLEGPGYLQRLGVLDCLPALPALVLLLPLERLEAQELHLVLVGLHCLWVLEDQLHLVLLVVLVILFYFL